MFSIRSIGLRRLWRSATARCFLYETAPIKDTARRNPAARNCRRASCCFLSPSAPATNLQQSKINANSIGCAIRNKHDIHPPVFLTRARLSCRGANLHARSVHALLVLQIFLAARRALAGQFRGPRFVADPRNPPAPLSIADRSANAPPRHPDCVCTRCLRARCPARNRKRSPCSLAAQAGGACTVTAAVQSHALCNSFSARPVTV